MLRHRAAARANRFFALAPANFPEHLERFRFGHFQDLAHGERPGGGREKEVLLVRHGEPRDTSKRVFIIHIQICAARIITNILICIANYLIFSINYRLC